jgi:hypothetical protein
LIYLGWSLGGGNAFDRFLDLYYSKHVAKLQPHDEWSSFPKNPFLSSPFLLVPTLPLFEL